MGEKLESLLEAVTSELGFEVSVGVYQTAKE